MGGGARGVGGSWLGESGVAVLVILAGKVGSDHWRG